MASSMSPTSPKGKSGGGGTIRKFFSGDSSAKSSTTSPPPAAASSSGSKKSDADGAELAKHIQQKAKSDKKEVHEVIENLDISTPYATEHKVKARFDEENLRYSGIPEEWKEAAHKQFGVPLAQCPRVELDGYADRIPLVLIKLRMRLEDLDGLTTEGIFRLAPNGQESTDVKAGINTGDALASLMTTKDPHVPSNLIKQFFRELPPNLLNPLHRDTIIEIAGLTNDDEISAALGKLPEPNYSTYMWFLDLLLDVAKNESKNLMTTKNLAIVVSPNLFFAGDNVAPMEALVLSQKVAQLVNVSLKWRTKTRPGKGAE